MFEEKPPPSYSHSSQSHSQAGFNQQRQTPQMPGDPSQQYLAPPPQGPAHQQSFQSGYNSTQSVGPMGSQPGYSPNQFGGPVGPQPGYPPASTMNASPGTQYQQQLFAMCAQGNHDATTKYGVVGIILAVVCFPCGLFALLCDREKRCVRCGVRVA
ncbi:hypothetical protein BD311DRAFT_755492 [Dichomitus squalens]|uniref:Uncharacterized protein n=2 Tax=Dichomitus squalens TaxID=114155 RepID=A0A4Q9MU77_9APHY|nr:hypothetical protein BD311DRAFT_755492 [Dichomitus squalens]